MTSGRLKLDETRLSQNLNYCREQVRGDDEARLLASAYAPAERQGGLLALYAFAAEIGRIPASVSEPPLGLIRLQWWREALDEVFGEGPVRAHPVVELMATHWRVGIAQNASAHGISRQTWRASLDEMLSAQEVLLTLDPFKDENEVVDYFTQSAGIPALLAVLWLAAGDEQGQARDQLPEEAIRHAAALNAIVQALLATPEEAVAGKAARLVQTAREKLATYAGLAGPETIAGLIDRLAPSLDRLGGQSPAVMPALAALAPARARIADAQHAMARGEYKPAPFAALSLRWKLFRTVMTGRI